MTASDNVNAYHIKLNIQTQEGFARATYCKQLYLYSTEAPNVS